jgi:hypothetical protein
MINIAILLATIPYVIAINTLLSGADQIGPGLRWGQRSRRAWWRWRPVQARFDFGRVCTGCR